MAFDLAAAQLAATVTLNLSVALLAGASMSSLWLRAGASAWSARHIDRLRAATLASATTALLADVALLWLEAAAMAEVPLTEAAPAIYSVLTATHYGLAWMIGMCALAAASALSAIRWRPGRARAAGLFRLAGLGVFLYSRSMLSHAGAGGDISWAVAADWLHLVLISLWVGEVLVAGLITLRETAAGTHQDRLACAAYVEALSTSATIALIGIFATGALSAWRGLGSLDNASGNPYADALLVKLALVGGAALLGGVNRFLVMPGLLAQLRGTQDTAAHPGRRFAGVLQIEAVLLVAALIVAAILSSTPPPSAG